MIKKLSVIIPALNEEANIGNCISSVYSIDRDGIEIEVILIDNGSTDRTLDIARGLGAKSYLLKGVNIAALRNFGAMKSDGDLLAFVDADCMVAKDWLKQAVKTINIENADAVGSHHIIPEDSGWIGRTAELIQQKKIGSEINYIPSGNFIIKKYVFESVGGFNENLETSEDVDICQRLKKNNYKIYINQDIHAIHYGTPNNSKELFLREMWHGKGVYAVFFNDPFLGRNKHLVFYCMFNLVIIISGLAGVLLAISGKASLLYLSLISYSVMTFVGAIKMVKGDLSIMVSHLISINCYTAIYGFARSVSLLWWLSGKLSGKQTSISERPV